MRAYPMDQSKQLMHRQGSLSGLSDPIVASLCAVNALASMADADVRWLQRLENDE
ncbi:hypothetical protein [Synechococcus sp. MIT S9509]|uniref:hypothetical protein n=1 Tax=Synechococcus sp. MIT S9509 TaxID=1801630 RepID=UPI0039B111DE